MYHISSTKIVKVCHLVSLIKKNKKNPQSHKYYRMKKPPGFFNLQSTQKI